MDRRRRRWGQLFSARRRWRGSIPCSPKQRKPQATVALLSETPVVVQEVVTAGDVVGLPAAVAVVVVVEGAVEVAEMAEMAEMMMSVDSRAGTTCAGHTEVRR